MTGAAVAHYRRGFQEIEGTLAGPEWLGKLRRDALERFADTGFPTTADEDWRYTNVAPLVATPFRPGMPGATPNAAAVATFLPSGASCARLVFCDGHFVPTLSQATLMPAGSFAGSLAGALRRSPALLEPHLAASADRSQGAFGALNAAFFADGAFLHLPRGCCLPEPIYILHLSSNGATPVVTHPRNLFLAGESSHASVVEVYAGSGAGAGLTNAVTEVVAGANASLEHVRIQAEGPRAFHVSSVHSRQERETNYAARAFLFGAALSRNDAWAILDGEGANAILDGLYLAGGSTHVDCHTGIEHRKPNGSSREVYKGILTGRASAVFHGRIHVHPGAQKTDAKQSNANLLLSREAVIDTKPQLEIYANDVKCTHGATIGRLDADALFYLQARGIDAAAARTMLVGAFAHEVTERVRVQPAREWLVRMFDARLLLTEERA
ncbi:MAG: Fe-S cluster assembly protein SufD [Planctomycetaceae bacterium]